ncbi:MULTISPECIES: hypothetical protein [Brevundimonas]|uniref:hypothetical protein n=1 Tax=Brevundimonas TaxID=41275 RepID=UPI0006CFC3D1|nr:MULTISPECIES: hypothetical protein [unclassified Brevundimonas]ALJ08862.1 hypothetical protein JL11_11285 [Brevundimonas sp. DS20]QFU31992.1 hypothetical protein BSP_09995 [Brevundimonas sp. Bb-A]
MTEGAGQHLYDAISAQKHQAVDSFADQREQLRKAVADQRLAAMPEEMRRAALGPSAQVSREIVDALRAIIAQEVTRQLDLAICAMLARAAETEEGAALSAEATHS